MPANERISEIGGFWLIRRSNGIYYICWYDAGLQQRQIRSTGTGDLQAAETALMKHVIAHGAPPAPAAPADLTIAEVLLRYYNDHGKKIPSHVQQRIACELWTRFYGEDTVVADLTPARQDAFHEFLLSLGHSKSYAHHTISTGRAALKHALNKRYIAVAPLIQTYFSKKEKDAAPPKGRPMSLNEIGALLDQFGEENNTDHVLKFCLTMLNTMCRPDAAFDLHSWQINDEFGYVQLNPEGRVQTDKFRPVVPLTEAMAHLVAGVRGPIVQIDGSPISSVKHAWATARSNAKLDDRVQPYSLRHSMSRYLIHRKVPRYQNSLMLGHAVPEGSTSITYAPIVLQETETARDVVNEIMHDLQKHTRHQLFPNAVYKARVEIDEHPIELAAPHHSAPILIVGASACPRSQRIVRNSPIAPVAGESRQLAIRRVRHR